MAAAHFQHRDGPPSRANLTASPLFDLCPFAGPDLAEPRQEK